MANKDYTITLNSTDMISVIAACETQLLVCKEAANIASDPKAQHSIKRLEVALDNILKQRNEQDRRDKL